MRVLSEVSLLKPHPLTDIVTSDPENVIIVPVSVMAMSIILNEIPTSELRTTRLWLAAPTLLAYLRDDFFNHWRRVIRRFQLDDVHDLRVSSRRLREGLALFSAVLPRKKVVRLSRKVKRLTTILGELRNIDEAELFFSGVASEESCNVKDQAEHLVRSLSKRRERARKELEKGLTALDARRLKRELSSLCVSLDPFRRRRADPFARFGTFADRALVERVGLVAELFPAALNEADSVAQHKLRIAFKKLRYRVEILAPLFDDGAEDPRHQLKRHQDILGKLHDLDVFAEMVPECVPEGSAREELSDLLAKRRAVLFASFIEAHGEQPFEALASRIRGGLSPPLQQAPKERPRKPRIPGRQRIG